MAVWHFFLQGPVISTAIFFPFPQQGFLFLPQYNYSLLCSEEKSECLQVYFTDLTLPSTKPLHLSQHRFLFVTQCLYLNLDSTNYCVVFWRFFALVQLFLSQLSLHFRRVVSGYTLSDYKSCVPRKGVWLSGVFFALVEQFLPQLFPFPQQSFVFLSQLNYQPLCSKSLSVLQFFSDLALLSTIHVQYNFRYIVSCSSLKV